MAGWLVIWGWEKTMIKLLYRTLPSAT